MALPISNLPSKWKLNTPAQPSGTLPVAGLSDQWKLPTPWNTPTTPTTGDWTKSQPISIAPAPTPAVQPKTSPLGMVNNAVQSSSNAIWNKGADVLTGTMANVINAGQGLKQLVTHPIATTQKDLSGFALDSQIQAKGREIAKKIAAKQPVTGNEMQIYQQAKQATQEKLEQSMGMIMGATGELGAGKQVVSGIAKDLEPLAQEARKYKSSEEFVKAQDLTRKEIAQENVDAMTQNGYDHVINEDGTFTLYHKTTLTGANGIERTGFRENSFFADSPESADALASTNKKGNSKIIEIKVDPADILYNSGTNEFEASSPLIKGRDGIYRAKETQTKSQLTDIWNKANKTEKGTKAIFNNANLEIDILQKTKAVNDVYNQVPREKYENAIADIWQELEGSKAGTRYSYFDPNSSDRIFSGDPSTFPKWIPDYLRKKDLFDKVMGDFGNGDFKYPEVNKTAQRELYDAILDKMDEKLGVDTSDLRESILENYDKQKTKKGLEKTASGGVRRGVSIAEEGKIRSLDESTKSKQSIPVKEILPESKSKPIRVLAIKSPESKPAIEKSKLATPAEKIASQDKPILDSSGQKIDTSLDNIMKNFPTDVKKKVNIIDYLFRTPENVIKKIGLGREMDKLRAGYDAYLKELPQNISKVTDWIKQVPSKESNQKIFLYLDGQNVVLNPTETKVAGEIKTWLAQWADRLKLPEDNRITHYITHLFDDQFIKKEFDEDLAKIISEKIPGSVYDPFLLKRLGAKGYKIDTWAALDAYVKRATRKVNMDEPLSAIERISPYLENSQWKYVKSYIDRVNLRPTDVDNLIDNAIKSSPIGYKLGQRPTMATTRMLRQAGFRGGLWFNVSSALRNLSQGINTYAVLGEKNTALGYLKLFSKDSQAELAKEGVLEMNMVEDRTISATKKIWQELDKVGFGMFQQVERINRGAAYFGAKAKAIASGKTEAQAVAYGKKVVAQTQFLYGPMDTPVALSSDLVKTLIQFNTYNVKQLEFLAGLAKNKQFGAMMRYTAAGLTFVYSLGKMFGMNPSELIPFSSNFNQQSLMPSSPALKFGGSVVGAAVNAPDKYGKTRSLAQKASDIGSTAWGIVPGGVQAKKTYQGAQDIMQGGSYNAAGKLQFKQGSSLPEKAQSLLFGKYAGQKAQDYYSSGGKSSETTKIKPIFDNIQHLISQGNTDAAQKILDGLSDTDYAEYKKMKSAAKAQETIALKKKVLPIYMQIQTLIKQGKKDDAQNIVDGLTDDEYKVYQLLKKSSQ